MSPQPLDEDTFGADQPCFGCGPNHPIGFRLRFERDGDAVMTRFTPTEHHQGPPGIMHGGLVMALADELAAWTIVGLKGRLGFTASVEARLVAPIRIGAVVVGRGHIVADTPRIVRVTARLEQNASEAFRGDFRFALLDQTGAERLLGARLPERWTRFCR